MIFSNDYRKYEFRQLSVFDKSGLGHRTNSLINISSRYQYDLSQSTSTSFSLSYGERVPSISEQYGFYLFNQQDGYDYLGDPDLKEERNVHIEFGQRIQLKNFRFESSAFAYLFDNYIMGIYDPTLSNMTIGALGVKWHRNTGSARMFGGELSMTNQLHKSLSSKLDLKYVYGEDFEGEPLPQMPPLKISYALNQELHGWIIQPEIEWSSAQNRISAKFNERSTDAFTLLNLRVSKEFESKMIDWNISAGIENLTDVAYREHFDIGRIQRPGRNGYVQLRVGF